MKKLLFIIFTLFFITSAHGAGIDLMGNNVPDNATIEAESLQQLNRTTPPREREKLSRADLAGLFSFVSFAD